MPIIAVTARSTGDEVNAIRDAGMDALLRKPMTGDDLDAALESVCSLAEASEVGEGAHDKQGGG